MGFKADQYLLLMLSMEISVAPCASKIHIFKEIPTYYSCSSDIAYLPPHAFSRGAFSSIWLMRSETIFFSEEKKNLQI